MTKDEALKLALEFIERVNKDGWILADFEPQMYAAITAIKEALAQTEQEPICPHCKAKVLYECVACSSNNYPPKPTWVGLTEEEVDEIYTSVQEEVNKHWDKGGTTMMFPFTLYKVIEHTLKERNT